ncbi:long-chain-fatty-acid--CoA ligase [Kitasatospora herbaricolor]|uniref:class I adenylate-forming enzyme family protein n=1 Tax=Kitasatospora herbaricolor TaxID=68217 RepID=UPI00174A0F4D|nr:class I adenylate-forming enzyme family protein [Kitasatospora herbaricolor]MDQ0306360.1 acyl-CoA synthetase (AMP-forming)/AMP-acid ligase II [Kitasatospora herbaricolor]GGV43915.1 long-chain-fatty-acid--CoA ligase [Kitasatospora herbaricolor]
MSIRSIRSLLADDPQVGAGNVLTSRIALGVGLDEPLLTFDTPVDEHAAWQPFTLRELDRAVRARAAALHALGVVPRDPVVVYAGDAADHVLSFLALTRLGAIPALLNPNLDGERAARYINRLGAAGILADAEHLAALAGHETGAPALPEIGTLGAGDPDAAPEPYRHWSGDPVAITHSSGTTGMPKAVVHSHAGLYAAIRHRLSLPRPQGSDRMLSALPAPHAATLIAVNLALSTQAEIALLSRQAGAGVLDAIESWRPRGVIGFAATWSELAHHDLAGRELDSVALWWNTGDCAHEVHIRRLIATGSRETVTREGRGRAPGSLFVDGLGSTEMGHSHFFITHGPGTERYGRCVGRPHAFVDCAVLGPDGEPLGPGEVGELGTNSPTLALGYWNDSATTFRTRVRGYFLTGDLMYRDEEGYWYHVDRAVDSVELGDGKRLFTAMSEERVLAACPEVVDCTVVAVKDGERVVTDVLLQLAAGADPATDRTKEVTAALDEHSAATVRQVLVVDGDRIPLGPTGKVRKVLLRQQYLDSVAAR